MTLKATKIWKGRDSRGMLIEVAQSSQDTKNPIFFIRKHESITGVVSTLDWAQCWPEFQNKKIGSSFLNIIMYQDHILLEQPLASLDEILLPRITTDSVKSSNDTAAFSAKAKSFKSNSGAVLTRKDTGKLLKDFRAFMGITQAGLGYKIEYEATLISLAERGGSGYRALSKIFLKIHTHIGVDLIKGKRLAVAKRKIKGANQAKEVKKFFRRVEVRAVQWSGNLDELNKLEGITGIYFDGSDLKTIEVHSTYCEPTKVRTNDYIVNENGQIAVLSPEEFNIIYEA